MTDKDSTVKNSKIFSLIRLKPDCKIAPVRVDFTTPHLPATPPISIIPAFNPDRSYYTPSFLLPADQKYYQQNLAFEQAQFGERIQRSLHESGVTLSLTSQQGVRMASPSSNYCQICQQKFEDYFRHIDDRSHRLREENSEATQLIHALCASLSRTDSAQEGRGKAKPIRKEVRQERQQGARKLKESKKKERGGGDRPSKGHNFSTALMEDSSIQFKE